jgi:hypothetical protein
VLLVIAICIMPDQKYTKLRSEEDGEETLPMRSYGVMSWSGALNIRNLVINGITFTAGASVGLFLGNARSQRTGDQAAQYSMVPSMCEPFHFGRPHLFAIRLTETINKHRHSRPYPRSP